MNIRKFLVLALAVNLIAAFAFHWTTVNKALVIVNALALLVFVVRKAFTKED